MSTDDIIRKHQYLTDLELLEVHTTTLQVHNDAMQYIRRIGEQIAAGSDDENLFLDLPKIKEIQNMSSIELQEYTSEIALREKEQKERQVAEEKRRKLEQLAQKEKESEELCKKEEMENKKTTKRDAGERAKPTVVSISCVRCTMRSYPCIWPATGTRQKSCEKCRHLRLKCQMDGELTDRNTTAKRKAPEKSVDKGGKKRAKLEHDSDSEEEFNGSDTANILEDALNIISSALEGIRSELATARHEEAEWRKEEVKWRKELAGLFQGLTHAVADSGMSKRVVRGKKEKEPEKVDEGMDAYLIQDYE